MESQHLPFYSTKMASNTNLKATGTRNLFRSRVPEFIPAVTDNQWQINQSHLGRGSVWRANISHFIPLKWHQTPISKLRERGIYSAQGSRNLFRR
jgi:hypothetical protein